MTQNKYLLTSASRNNLVRLISRHKQTRKIDLAVDYPNIKSYLTDKFPKVQISHIPIYVVDNDYISRKGFKYCGGFFLRDPACIIVKEDPAKSSISKTKQSRINKLLSKHMYKATLEDVILHECIHAVSFTMGRYSRVHSHMEEEFVYTNSVDYYLKGDIKEDQEVAFSVIDKVFLPFLVNDIVNSKIRMEKIVLSLGLNDVEIKHYFNTRGQAKKYEQFMSKHADLIEPAIIKIAHSNGHTMIKKYRTLNNTGLTQSIKNEMIDTNITRSKPRLSRLIELD